MNTSKSLLKIMNEYVYDNLGNRVSLISNMITSVFGGLSQNNIISGLIEFFSNILEDFLKECLNGSTNCLK